MSVRVKAIAAIAALAAFPAAAHAGPRADYWMEFTTATPGASTGAEDRILYKHPDDPNAKPNPIRREVFTFPAGTQFDASVVPDCTVSDDELQLVGETACPSKSWIGRGLGDTAMTGLPGAGETTLVANMFRQGDGFRILGEPEGVPLRFVAYARREGRVLTVDIPPIPGEPPDGGAIRRINNIFPARSLGRRAYIRTPRKCPSSRVWTFKVRMIFADGAVERNVHRMRCRRTRS
jgi:hypothetical protein